MKSAERTDLVFFYNILRNICVPSNRQKNQRSTKMKPHSGKLVWYFPINKSRVSNSYFFYCNFDVNYNCTCCQNRIIANRRWKINNLSIVFVKKEKNDDSKTKLIITSQFFNRPVNSSTVSDLRRDRRLVWWWAIVNFWKYQEPFWTRDTFLHIIAHSVFFIFFSRPFRYWNSPVGSFKKSSRRKIHRCFFRTSLREWQTEPWTYPLAY